jgi:hypothetical protein
MEKISAIAKRTQPTQLSRGLRPESSRKIGLMKKLASICLDRGEGMDDIRLESYSKALEQFPDVAIDAAFARLAETRRGEFEPRIPEKGDLIDQVRSEARKRDKPRDCEVCFNGRRVIVEVDGRREARWCQCYMDWKSMPCGKGPTLCLSEQR